MLPTAELIELPHDVFEVMTECPEAHSKFSLLLL
jgi:hypothetical protein